MAQKNHNPYDTPKHEHQYGKLIVGAQVGCFIILLLFVLDAAFGILGGHFINGVKSIGNF